MALISDETIHYFISTICFTNRVTDCQCGDNEHSSPEKENDARSSHTAIRPTYLYADKSKMKSVNYSIIKCYDMFLDGCSCISTKLL